MELYNNNKPPERNYISPEEEEYIKSIADKGIRLSNRDLTPFIGGHSCQWVDNCVKAKVVQISMKLKNKPWRKIQFGLIACYLAAEIYFYFYNTHSYYYIFQQASPNDKKVNWFTRK